MTETPALTFCLPTLFPDLGRSTDEHLLAAVQAAADAGFEGLDLFASSFVQAVESVVAGGERVPLVPRADRRSAIADFRAAALRWPQALARTEAQQLRDEIRRRGLHVEAVECMSLWPAGADAAEADARAICEVAQFLGARYVVAVCLSPEMEPAGGAQGLRRAADVAAEYGLEVCLEWLPGTAVPSLAEGWQLIQLSAATNVGFTLDALHWQCQPGGPDWATLGSLPADSIRFLQLSDCRLPLADGVIEPSRRLLPGEGNIDLTRLLGELRRHGMVPVPSVEVFDEESLMQRGMQIFAAQQADTLRGVLGAAANTAP